MTESDHSDSSSPTCDGYNDRDYLSDFSEEVMDQDQSFHQSSEVAPSTVGHINEVLEVCVEEKESFGPAFQHLNTDRKSSSESSEVAPSTVGHINEVLEVCIEEKESFGPAFQHLNTDRKSSSESSKVAPSTVGHMNEILEVCVEEKESFGPAFQHLDTGRKSSSESSKVVSSSTAGNRMEEFLDAYLKESSDTRFLPMNPGQGTPPHLVTLKPPFGLSFPKEDVPDVGKSNAMVTSQLPDLPCTVEEYLPEMPQCGDLYGIQPGTWVAVNYRERVIPAMFIRHVNGKVEVKKVRALKSGFKWGSSRLFERSNIICTIDTPNLLDQVGSKSKPRREALYF